MKGASLTGGGFGQTKLRGGRGPEKESSATGGAQTKGAEQRAASSGGKGQHDKRGSGQRDQLDGRARWINHGIEQRTRTKPTTR